MVGCTSYVSYSVGFHEVSKSVVVNCGSLSVTICSGRPYEAKIPRSTSIVFATVIDDISSIFRPLGVSINCQQEHGAFKWSCKVQMHCFPRTVEVAKPMVAD